MFTGDHKMILYILGVVWVVFAALVAGYLFLASTPMGFYLRYKVWPELSMRQYAPLPERQEELKAE